MYLCISAHLFTSCRLSVRFCLQPGRPPALFERKDACLPSRIHPVPIHAGVSLSLMRERERLQGYLASHILSQPDHLIWDGWLKTRQPRTSLCQEGQMMDHGIGIM